ncbi:hypothetical protein DPEC_G00175340 [Dallia pectoralis]|uniref:Uncharacterized protein n=1 Tax=Dallia pectoralis TaxID=75939 RepID=A0ACC2GE62_DALPE|nr:hypothetical protein DPEC_G00175340 [Dallia pectoralis]
MISKATKLDSHYVAAVMDRYGSGWLCLDDKCVQRTDVATVLKRERLTLPTSCSRCVGPSDAEVEEHSRHSKLCIKS